MRLWHYKMIPDLSNQRLLGQHRECCALRGKGWGKPHSVVNYVFSHDYSQLYAYHYLVIVEMLNRGYNINPLWLDNNYRGKLLGYDDSNFTSIKSLNMYPEHDEKYYIECVENIKKKEVR